MTVGSREDYRVGTPSLDVLGTMDIAVDSSSGSLVSDINIALASAGVQLTPYDSIVGVVSSAPDDEVIRLLPGRYRILSTIEIKGPVTIEGVGNVRLVSEGTAIRVTGSRVTVRGISFEQTGTTDSSTVTLDGTFGAIDECVFIGKQTNGVLVNANNCAVRNSRFVPDVSQGSVDADIYWADAANDGIALGNMWSGERGYVISYKSGTDFTEAANAKPAAIEARV